MVHPNYQQRPYYTQNYAQGCQTNPSCDPKDFEERNHFNGISYRKVQKVAEKLEKFKNTCNSILSDLGSAETTEFFDSMTSNQSLLGSFISNASYYQNHNVAKRLDHLKEYAEHINCDLKKLKREGFPLEKLDTNLSGKKIRRAENAEHSFLSDLFTSGAYSSVSSMNTARELASKKEKLYQVRGQASYNIKVLKKGMH